MDTLDNFINNVEDDNILYFDNDDDFAAWAIGPTKVNSGVNANGESYLYMYHEFTNRYNNALNTGKKFCIKDIKSHVNKDGLLDTGWNCYEIPHEHIEKYYGED